MRNVMPNYTKLFSTIVTSTIWQEPDRTRIVWITMLALSDKNGEIHASIPGLARIAGVPTADCETAINAFLSPDAYSRTPEHEGRRIAKIDGGWELLNFQKYRLLASTADTLAKNASRQKRFRDRNGKVTDSNADVTHSNAPVTVNTLKAEADTDSKAEAEEIIQPVRKRTREGFEKFWSIYPKKKGKGDAEKAWNKADCTLEQCEEAIESAKESEQWQKDNGQFIPYPASWLNSKSWLDEIEEEYETPVKSEYMPPIKQKSVYELMDEADAEWKNATHERYVED